MCQKFRASFLSRDHHERGLEQSFNYSGPVGSSLSCDKLARSGTAQALRVLCVNLVDYMRKFRRKQVQEAGAAYSSFMRWQRQKRSLRRLVEEAERTYRERQSMEFGLETLLSEESTALKVRSHRHNRRPYRDPDAQPVKWMKLIQWWLLHRGLVHRVPIESIITPPIEAAACQRFKIPESKWEEAKKRFPSLLPKVNQKRLRRIEYALETGKFPPKGWTPPDPKNRATQNVAPYMQFWKH
jgi:hypothetical protein